MEFLFYPTDKLSKKEKKKSGGPKRNRYISCELLERQLLNGTETNEKNA